VSGTKWCVGHTLAASGALDVIAACEALRRRTGFRLMTTETADPGFDDRYLCAHGGSLDEVSRVMITSLGFGGLQAAAVVEAAGERLSP
jgi:3-oxoacyl-(acyl-carrier-protein) synthase